MIQPYITPLARRLRDLRKERGLKQAYVASLAGISVTALSMYERGDRDPNVARAIAWARALGMELDLREGS